MRSRALETLDPRQSRVVELRFFGGLSLEEAAHVLGVSVATVRRDWSIARAWLFRELRRGHDTRTAPRRSVSCFTRQWSCRTTVARRFSIPPAAKTSRCAIKWNRLLRAHEEAGEFIATPAIDVEAPWLAPEAAPGAPRGRIGAYQVLSLIGRGGMGEVYLAPGHQAWPQGRAQGAALRLHQQSRRRPPFRARSARRFIAQPPEHRHHPRDRRDRRPPVPGDGVRGRAFARYDDWPARRVIRLGDPDRRAAGPGARRGPCRRNRAP